LQQQGGSGHEDTSEDAIIAASQAILNHSLLAGWNPAAKAHQWLTEAGDYREVARAALTAALPYLRHQSETNMP
jgi:hypothetical protein